MSFLKIIFMLFLLQAGNPRPGQSPAPQISSDAAMDTDPNTDAAAAVTVKPPTGLAKAEGITTQAVHHLEQTISQTPMLGWILLFAGIFGGLVAGKIAQITLRNIGQKLTARGWAARGAIFLCVPGPINLVVITTGLSIGLTGVAMDPPVRDIVTRVIGFFYVLSFGWFLYNLVDLVELGIRRVTDDDTIIQLIRKALRIFLLAVFGLFVAQNFFNADISAWLAGLGLAGLAVSLAAQGPIKNLFGSVTVVLDRPFGLGDRITFGDKTGVVETMGFRSTKLRTMDGHLVTIPNSKLIEDVVENITARPYIRRATNITITYDTPPEKIEQALQIIRSLLAEPFMASTFDMVEFPPRVSFNNFNADSLNISVAYWYQLNLGDENAQPRDWWTFNAQSEEFNLKLLRAFNQAGIDFAFPTQTVYLAGDPKRELSLNLANTAAPAGN